MSVLHVLTPAAPHAPAALIRAEQLAAGDVIADLRRATPLAWRVAGQGELLDVTDELLPPADYWAVARDWLADLTARAGLAARLAVAGYSFWWPVDAKQFVPSFSDLGNLFAWIDLLAAVRDGFPPERIVVHGEHRAIRHLAGQLYGTTPIDRRAGSAAPGPPAVPQWTVLRAVRVLLGVAVLAGSLLRRPHALFLSTTNLLRARRVDGRERIGDVYLDDVAGALRARGWRTLFVENYAGRASWRNLRVRGLFFPDDVLWVLSHPRLAALGLNRRLVARWRRRWAAAEPDLPPLLRYRECDVAPLVLPLIRGEFLYGGPRMDSLVGLWRWLLRRWRPRLLYVNCYDERFNLPAIIAARLLGVLTVEQQHGIISGNHVSYMIPAAAQGAAGVPVCDRMVVWGDYAKRLLVGAGLYRPDELAVCGFPQMDAVFGSLPPRDETLARLGIPSGARVALYTSNRIVQDLYPDLLDSLAGGPEEPVYWIVKLHPAERTRALWERAAQDRGLACVRVVEGEIDFYALLAACDLHASYVSTTLIEAAALGKPNVGLELPHTPDPAGYAEAGAYLAVAPRDLGRVARELLDDPARMAALVAEQRAFADDWLRHDGRAVGCIVSTLEEWSGPGRRAGREEPC